MRRNTISALALASLFTLVLPLAADAQTPQPPLGSERGDMQMRGDRARMGNHARMGGRAGMAEPGAQAERVLALREELALTDAQATRITEVAAQLRDRNAPLLAQLEGARAEMRAGQMEMMEQRRDMTAEQREEMRAAMRQRMGAQMEERRAAKMEERRGAMQREPMAGGARRMMPDELRPVMEQVRANTQAAAQEIRSILTAEQHEKLRDLRGAPRGPAGR